MKSFHPNQTNQGLDRVAHEKLEEIPAVNRRSILQVSITLTRKQQLQTTKLNGETSTQGYKIHLEHALTRGFFL